jgi:hypothetical protein
MNPSSNSLHLNFWHIKDAFFSPQERDVCMCVSQEPLRHMADFAVSAHWSCSLCVCDFLRVLHLDFS